MKMEQIPQKQNIGMERERQAFVEKGKYIPINKFLSYGIDGGDLHIHVAPAGDLGIAEKMTLVKNGLIDLARVVHGNLDIKEISATSWIVAKNPELLERLGFKIDDSPKTNLRLSAKRIYQVRSRPLARAVISREDFLEKYFNK